MLVGKRRFIIAVMALVFGSLLAGMIILKSPGNASGVIQSIGILLLALLSPVMTGMALDKNKLEVKK